jgi:hypothetical protein
MGNFEAEDTLCKCPRCGADTNSLKVFEFPQITFLVFAHSHRIEHIAACPSCLRKYLASWGLTSLVSANLLWPIIILPLLISRFFASFLHGHYSGKKSILQKLAGGLLGLVLVISGFAVAVGIVGMFGASSQTCLYIFAVAVVVMIVSGFLAAYVGL